MVVGWWVGFGEGGHAHARVDRRRDLRPDLEQVEAADGEDEQPRGDLRRG